MPESLDRYDLIRWDRFYELADAIEGHPIGFHQASSENGDPRLATTADCQSACCVLGWAKVLYRPALIGNPQEGTARPGAAALGLVYGSPFVDALFAAVWPIRWFERVGMRPSEETGRLYQHSSGLISTHVRPIAREAAAILRAMADAKELWT